MTEETDAVVILAKCGETHRTYGIRTEKAGFNRWRMTWAFPIKEAAAKREGYERTTINGEIEFSDEFPGCPYCGSHQFTVCSNGHIGCTILKHGYYTCEWCGSAGKVGNYEGDISIYAGLDV